VRSLRVVEKISNPVSPLLQLIDSDREALDQRTFRRMIAIERKRSERSKEPFLLMLLEPGIHPDSREGQEVLASLLNALRNSSRETDVIGWYRDQAVIGVMFTGLMVTDKNLLLTTILSRVSAMLGDELTFEQFNQVSLSFHFFPDDWDHENGNGPTNSTLYPDLMNPGKRKNTLLLVKRGIDLLGSTVALILLSPAFLAIALAIKMTSKGPVLFRQQRVGQYGSLFTVLKFRSMYARNT